MHLNLDDSHLSYRIQSYEKNKIVINNTFYTDAFIVSPQQIWPNHYLNHLAEAHEESHFLPFLTLKPQIFLFGTGETQQFLSPWLQSLFYQHAIGVEAMTTAAACRTYNLLLAEGRYVMASFLL